MTKKEIDQFVTELKKDDSNTIRVKDDNNNPTKKLNYRNTNVSFAPSIEVEHGKQTDVYEFEKSYSVSKLNELITKWILFSIRAKKLSGKCYIVVKAKDAVKFNKIIREKSLDIEVIPIS